MEILHALQIWMASMVGLLALVGHFSVAAVDQILSPHEEVMFTGDMMFDRSVRDTMNVKGTDFVFSCISPELTKPDVVVANLEGPITGNTSKSSGSVVGSPNNFRFTFPLSIAPLLYKNNVRIVSLGNNHILNFGYQGLASTTDALNAAGVGYFGDPGVQSVYESNENHIPVTYINYNQFDGGSTGALTLRQIKAAKQKGRFPVVFAHWGDEYRDANAEQKKLAHQFIDAGAELVIGGHPHVIQEHEVYAGKNIYYSLGNFIFDQYWDDNVRKGMIVYATFGASGVEAVREGYVTLEKDRRTCLAT